MSGCVGHSRRRQLGEIAKAQKNPLHSLVAAAVVAETALSLGSIRAFRFSPSRRSIRQGKKGSGTLSRGAGRFDRAKIQETGTALRAHPGSGYRVDQGSRV